MIARSFSARPRRRLPRRLGDEGRRKKKPPRLRGLAKKLANPNP
jgi:hypothetical protein